MPTEPNLLGILTPVGGGDPVPLHKPEVIIGRRASCDICLDFVNVSGKHCALRFADSVWHVRDLGSTNGTSLNGAKVSGEEALMPDDEFGVASHMFTIVYDPGASASLDHEAKATGKPAGVDQTRRSLLELAGIEDPDKPKARPPVKERAVPETGNSKRPAAEEPGFDDPLPDHFPSTSVPAAEVDEDDFLKLFDENLIKKPEP